MRNFDLLQRYYNEKWVAIYALHNEESNMADTKPNPTPPLAPKPPVTDPPAVQPQKGAQTLEERVTELENVVHTLALAVSGPHWDKGGWLERVGTRIKAAVKGK